MTQITGVINVKIATSTLRYALCFEATGTFNKSRCEAVDLTTSV